MAPQEKIIKLLPENLHSVAMNYTIPDDMLENNTDLVVLVLESKSINEPKEKPFVPDTPVPTPITGIINYGKYVLGAIVLLNVLFLFIFRKKIFEKEIS